MRLLSHFVHESLAHIPDLEALSLIRREAARGIILEQDRILLMYTSRYDDFSFPGGGIDAGEDPLIGLRRELAEEAGAHAVDVIAPFGQVTEYIPTWKSNYEAMFQRSHWFHCELLESLQQNKLEHYEVANGMEVKWVPIQEAISHNLAVIKSKPAHMGLSIVRETSVLQRVAEELIAEAEVGI